MILEAAMLQVKAGCEKEFEVSFAEASGIISAAEGYLGHELQRCMEVTGKYLLLVRWVRVEDRTIGFRQSRGYDEWKRLLHPYYEPFPTVEHFVEVDLEGIRTNRR